MQSNMQSSSSTDDMCKEENRLKTFDSGWPVKFVNPKILATIGMYYIGPGARAKCFSCGVEIGDWQQTESELAQHQRQTSNCPLLEWTDTKNVPLDELALGELIVKQWPTVDNEISLNNIKVLIRDRALLPEKNICACGHPVWESCRVKSAK